MIIVTPHGPVSGLGVSQDFHVNSLVHDRITSAPAVPRSPQQADSVWWVFSDLEELGVDYGDVTEVLESNGLATFGASWMELGDRLRAARRPRAARWPGRAFIPEG